jgi:hypothetical protein
MVVTHDFISRRTRTLAAVDWTQALSAIPEINQLGAQTQTLSA